MNFRRLSLIATAAATIAGGTALAQDLYLGVASCAGSTCHGAAEPFANSPVLQNEFVTWQRHDPHSKAYAVLKEERSIRIARNLGLSKPAHEAPECLACHSSYVPEAQRGARFQLSDGVGCESCHGPSERWLGLHASGRATHEQNVELGLLATEDPAVRASICLDCHIGSTRNSLQFVDHRIMGAGHPRMNFELDTFTAVQPAHYAMDKDYFERKKVTDGVAVWGIGQAMMVERRMQLLASGKGRQGMFPELVFFDCHACHEPMSQLDWVPRPNADLGPGWPKLQDAHMLMLQMALFVKNPGLANQVASDVKALHAALRQDQAALNSAAQKMAQTARQAVAALAAGGTTGAQMDQTLITLATRGTEGDYVDFEAAEQATMAMGAAIEARKMAGQIDEAGYQRMVKALEQAYAAVNNDEQYKRQDFKAASQAILGTAR